MFQWRLNQSHPARRNLKFPDDQTFLVLACALSLILCSALSSSLFGIINLNWAVLPAFIGMLYGSFRSRLVLGVLLLVCTSVFHYPFTPLHILLDSNILIFPLVFSLAKRFKRGTDLEKISIMWGLLASCTLFRVLTPLLDGKSYSGLQTDEIVLILSMLFFRFLLGGLMIYLIESALDKLEIDERMAHMSEKFKQETDNFQQITNMVPLSIISIDDNYKITSINDTMMKKLENRLPNIKRSDVLFLPVFDLIHKLKLNEEKELDRLLEIIFLKHRFMERVTCSGRVLHIFAAPLVPQAPGQIGGMVLVIQDVTEEELIRSELDHVERLTLVGQMAAGITHEIRNPMAVVRGFLQLMREKSSSDMDSYYQIVMDELDRANSIITDFLSLAQSGISSKEDGNLHDVIEELAPLLWADANLRGQSVELKLCDSLPVLRLNIKEIKQVVLNLGRNAMEAMEPKGVLTLETRCESGMVELLVKDTGCGMSEMELEKLFVPFFTTKDQGTGLGLPLCLSIVERHGGTISVDSRTGAGTVFTVSFPYEAQEKATYAEV
ncbi:two-component system sensor histidine kinase NtrB [Paenibacillus rhizophilus]|uniref:two-component system sensor histidine kinase NtrB n=1 Tax=Paenibacillus rhizophilus TaxID=1850366 RepID=UPI001FE5F3DB|nr:ATP-binding protein [Paenibacillus rhizophilus]